MANDPLVVLNVGLCAAIVVRLMFYRRNGAAHRWWASWLAYALIVAYASVPIRFLYHFYIETHWAVISINLIICIAVFRAKGNVAKLFRVLRPQ